MLNFLSRHRLFAVVAGTFLLLTIATAISFFVPLVREVCGKNEYTNAKECADYHIAAAVFWYLVAATNNYGSAITALATIAVASFTATLWWASTSQYDLLEKQIALARDEFNATHRPRLVVREVYWEPDNSGAVTYILGNEGSSSAKMVEHHVEFGRTDDRPITPSGMNITDDWTLARGRSESLTFTIGENGQFELGAFQEGGLESVKFQGLFIYSDKSGNLYRSVFKRVCRKGGTAFSRTGNPDDEYSA